MTSFQKRTEEKSCNCRNSKSRLQCNKNCHCVDCHNRNNNDLAKMYKDYPPSLERRPKEQINRGNKGCACRKSNCTKRYCQCFQSGLPCSQLCKCIQCQNNQSITNRKVITELKKFQNDINSKPANLYPIILSQNSDHLNNIILSSNPLGIDDNFINQSAQNLFSNANQSEIGILKNFIQILASLENKINQNFQMKDQQLERSP